MIVYFSYFESTLVQEIFCTSVFQAGSCIVWEEEKERMTPDLDVAGSNLIEGEILSQNIHISQRFTSIGMEPRKESLSVMSLSCKNRISIDNLTFLSPLSAILVLFFPFSRPVCSGTLLPFTHIQRAQVCG